jgi:hypothetical protein
MLLINVLIASILAELDRAGKKLFLFTDGLKHDFCAEPPKGGFFTLNYFVCSLRATYTNERTRRHK